MTDLFAPDAAVRRINREPAVFLGAGRALLLQLAHPAVARGVDEHSDFKANPFTRLRATLEATQAVVFGSTELAEAVGRRVRRVHRHVRGPGYAADDPANLLWVHATLVDTALACHEAFLGPVDPADAEAYLDGMATVAEVFGVPRDAQPTTLADFRAYVDRTVAGLVVTPTGRDLGRFVVDPVLPLRLHVPLRPALAEHRLLTLGLLPASIRAQYGFRWDADRQRRFDRAAARLRRTGRTLPTPVRTAANRAGGGVLVRRAARRIAA